MNLQTWCIAEISGLGKRVFWVFSDCRALLLNLFMSSVGKRRFAAECLGLQCLECLFETCGGFEEKGWSRRVDVDVHVPWRVMYRRDPECMLDWLRTKDRAWGRAFSIRHSVLAMRTPQHLE